MTILPVAVMATIVRQDTTIAMVLSKMKIFISYSSATWASNTVIIDLALQAAYQKKSRTSWTRHRYHIILDAEISPFCDVSMYFFNRESLPTRSTFILQQLLNQSSIKTKMNLYYSGWYDSSIGWYDTFFLDRTEFSKESAWWCIRWYTSIFCQPLESFPFTSVF